MKKYQKKNASEESKKKNTSEANGKQQKKKNTSEANGKQQKKKKNASEANGKQQKKKNASEANGTRENNVFIETINMETQTIFHNNGSVNIYPCDFELGQHIIANGRNIASQKGRMTTDDDGRSHFRPYAKGSGHRYMRLFDTPHGEMKMTKENIIFTLKFPKRFGKALIEKLLGEESDMMKAYVKSRRTETHW